MLLAAADPVGDATLVWRAAQTLGLDRTAVPAVSEQLLEIGARVRFRHPLVRSAVYRCGIGRSTSRSPRPCRRHGPGEPHGSSRRCATFIATRTSPTSSLRVRSCGDEPALKRGRGGFGACSPVRCRPSDTDAKPLVVALSVDFVGGRRSWRKSLTWAFASERGVAVWSHLHACGAQTPWSGRTSEAGVSFANGFANGPGCPGGLSIER